MIVVYVVMQERESGRSRGEVALTPSDHSRMQIDSDVAFWTRPLLNELTRESSAATTEIKNALEGARVHKVEDQRTS